MDISPIRVVRAQCCAGIPQLRWCARNRRHILQQRCQGGEHRNVNIGSGANTPGRAGRPIEHPGRNLQPSPGCSTREAATENLSASLLNNLMNMDQASGPRMPRIKKLVLRDPVGVPSTTTVAADLILEPTETTGDTRHLIPHDHANCYASVTDDANGMKVERLQQIRRRVRRAYQEISSAGGFQIRNYLETQNCKLTFLIDLPRAYQRTSTRTYFQHQVRGFQWVQ